MDVQKSVLDLAMLTGEAVSQTLLDSEIPLPEGRSAKDVLVYGAAIRTEGTECLSGQVRVSGLIEITALCEDMEGSAFGFTASSSFTHRLEVPAAREGMRAEALAQVLELTLRPDGTRLRLGAVAEVAVTVFSQMDTSVVTEITGPGVETKSAPVPIGNRVLLGESMLRIREEIDAPDARRVLLSTGGVFIKEVAYAGSVAEVSGTLFLSALLETDSGQFETKNITVPFTQEMDAAYSAAPLADAALLSLTLTAADAGFSLLDAEAVIRIRLYGEESRSLCVLADAYDERCSFLLEKQDVRYLNYLGGAAKRTGVRESVRIPKHLPEAYQALFALVTPVLADTNGQDGRLFADAMLLATFVYRCDGGFLHSFSEDIPVRFPLDVMEEGTAAAQLTILSAAVSGSGRTIELQTEIGARTEQYGEGAASLVTDVAAGGTPPPYRGILIYCADAGETLFDVGKRFAVPTAKLRTWNRDLVEPMADGQTVVLMK